MVDLESDAFPFIAESNAGFSTSNGLGGISDSFDSTGPFGISLNPLSSVESSKKIAPTSTSLSSATSSSSAFVLTTSANAAAADPVMPSTSRKLSSNFLDELCGTGNGGTSQQQNRSAQENEYLKELTELLQDTLSRPDSSLRNVDKSMLMDLVKRLKQQSKDKPENAVQHEDVSSSGSILLASHIGPMILEYLDGFFFVMNTDGFVEFVSQNVSKYLKFDQSEMVNKPIYNFVVAEDHDLFSGLLPENMAWNLLGFGNNFDVVKDSSQKLKYSGADSLSLKNQQQQRKSHRFMCQFLTNAVAECSSADILPTYQNLQVTAICLPLPSSSSGFSDEDDFHLSFNVMTESQPCLVCVARRLPDRSTTNFEGCQFSVCCNKSGLILDVNFKERATSQLLPKDISSSAMQIQQLFHVQDASFFEKVLQNDCSIKLPSISILKLFHSTVNNYLPVQVKYSKLGQSKPAGNTSGASASGLFSPSPLSPDSFHNVPFVQFDFLVLRSDDNQSQPSCNSAAASFADFFIFDSKDCADRLKNPLDKQHQPQETFPETPSLNNRNANGNNFNISIDQSSSAPYPPPFDDNTFFLNDDFHYYGGNDKNLNVAIGNTMGGLMGDDFQQGFESESDPSSLDVKPQSKPPLNIKSPSTIASVAVSTPAAPLDFNVNNANVVAASTQQQQQTSSFNQRSISVMSEPIVAASSFFQSSTSQITSQTEVQENDLQRFCQMMNLPPTATQDMMQNSPFPANQLDQINHIESGEQMRQEGHTILKELLSQEEKQQQQQTNPNVSFCEQPFHSPMLQNFAMQQQYFAPLQSDIMIGPPPPAPSHLQEPLPPPTHAPNGKRKNKTTPRKNAATAKKNSKKAANNNNVGWIPNQSFGHLAGNNTQSSTIDVSNFVQNRTAKNPLNCMPSPLQQQQQTHILQQLLQEDEACSTAETQVNAKMVLGKRKASINAHGQPITPPAFFVTPASQFAVQNQQVKSESLLIQLLERPLASHANQTRSLPTSIANTQFDKIAKENQENPNKQPIISTLIVESLLNNSKNAKQQQQFNQNTPFSSGFYQPRPSVCQNPILASSPFIGQNVSQVLSPNKNLYSQILDAPVRPPSDNSVNSGQNHHFPVNNSPPMQNGQESFMEILSQGTMSRNSLQTTPNTLHSPPQQMMPPQNQRTFLNNCPMSNASTAGNVIEIYDISPPNSYGQPNKLNPPSLPQNVRQRNNNQGNPPQPKKPRQRNNNSTKKPSKKQLQQEQQQQQQAALNQQYLASPAMNNFSAANYQSGNVVVNQQQFYCDRNESAAGFNFPISVNQERFSNGQNRFTANKMQQQNISVNDNLSNYPSPNNGPFSPMRNGPTAFQQNAACMTRPPAPGCASTSHQNNFKNVDPMAQQLSIHQQQQRFVAHQQPQMLPNSAFVNNNQQQPQTAFQNRQRIWSDSDNQFLNRHQQSNKTLSHVATLPSLTNQDLSPFDQHEPVVAAADHNKNRQRRPRAASSSEIAPIFNNNAPSAAIPRQQNLNSAEQSQQIFDGQSTLRQPLAPQTASGAAHLNANEWWTMNVDLDGEPDMDDEVTQNLLKMLNES